MKKAFFAAAVLVSAVSSIASAQTAVTFTGGLETTQFPNRTFGYAFTVNSAVNIGQLGYYDYNGDGLKQSHQVGIWNSTGTTLLGSATVGAGTTAALIDGFRFVDVTPFSLGVGDYLIGGFLGSNEDAVVRLATANTISQITLGSTRFDPPSSGSFTAPTLTQGSGFDSGYFGPNFRVLTSAVPEPASWALMIAGFGLIGWAMRRRSPKHALV